MFQLKYDLSDLTGTEQKYIEEKLENGHLVDVEHIADAWASHLMFKDVKAETDLNISHGAVVRKCARLLEKAGYVAGAPDDRYSWTPVGVTSKAFDDVHPVKPDIKQLCMERCDPQKHSSPRPFVYFKDLEASHQKYILQNHDAFELVVLENYDSWNVQGFARATMAPFEGLGKHTYGVILFDTAVLKVAAKRALDATIATACLFTNYQNSAFSVAFDKVAERVEGMKSIIHSGHKLRIIEEDYPFSALIQHRRERVEADIVELKATLRRLNGFAKAYTAEFPKGAKEAIVEAIKKVAEETASHSWYHGVDPAAFTKALKAMRKKEKTTK